MYECGKLQMKIVLKQITPNAESFIGEMAGICYNGLLEKHANIKRAAKCADDGHLSTLRFAHATFGIYGISRVCSHQLVRSKHLDFLQRSQRYCKEDLDIEDFTIPPIATPYHEDELIIHNDKCRKLYYKLLDEGWKKEDARFVLPEATHTEMNVVGNLQGWKDFIKLRSDKHAQWEVREVATQINNILSKECPNLFKEIN